MPKPSLKDYSVKEEPREPDPAPTRAEPPPIKRTYRLHRSVPHVSLYLDRRVQAEIKKLAADQFKRPHDLYVEAVQMLLRRYKLPSMEELTK